MSKMVCDRLFKMTTILDAIFDFLRFYFISFSFILNKAGVIFKIISLISDKLFSMWFKNGV